MFWKLWRLEVWKYHTLLISFFLFFSQIHLITSQILSLFPPTWHDFIHSSPLYPELLEFHKTLSLPLTHEDEFGDNDCKSSAFLPFPFSPLKTKVADSPLVEIPETREDAPGDVAVTENGNTEAGRRREGEGERENDDAEREERLSGSGGLLEGASQIMEGFTD